MTPSDDDDRTASLMTPARLAQLRVRPAQAASPQAWLDQMAADAGSGHVRLLADLRRQLEAAVRGREGDFRSVAGNCQALHDALQQLDFALVEPKGWLARATGKGKEASASFHSQHARTQKAADDLADGLRGLKKKQSSLAADTDRIAREMDAETRALEKIMDQGARWLQDMRIQLKAREAEATDLAVQQQVAQDNARCELLVSRLKLLRAVNTATQQALERCKSMTGQRASLIEFLQQVLDTEWKSAAQKIDRVADAVGGGSAPEGVERATRACAAAAEALKQAVQDCGSAQAGEQAAADELAAAQLPLDAAA